MVCSIYVIRSNFPQIADFWRNFLPWHSQGPMQQSWPKCDCCTKLSCDDCKIVLSWNQQINKVDSVKNTFASTSFFLPASLNRGLSISILLFLLDGAWTPPKVWPLTAKDQCNKPVQNMIPRTKLFYDNRKKLLSRNQKINMVDSVKNTFASVSLFLPASPNRGVPKSILLFWLDGAWTPPKLSSKTAKDQCNKAHQNMICGTKLFCNNRKIALSGNQQIYMVALMKNTFASVSFFLPASPNRGVSKSILLFWLDGAWTPPKFSSLIAKDQCNKDDQNMITHTKTIFAIIAK